MPQDPEADAHLKEIGNQLVNQLIKRFLRLNAKDTMGAFAQATKLAKAAVGFLPIGDGPDKMPDYQIAAAIPRVEAILAIIAVYEG